MTIYGNFEQDGFILKKAQINQELISKIITDTLKIGVTLGETHDSLDDLWNALKKNNRENGGKIYNAMKHLPSVTALASSTSVQQLLKEDCKFQHPALVDINCRIDSCNEEKYLFDWHQDYWFSVCSKNAIVVWIPLTSIHPETGGLSIISNRHTNSKIYKTAPGSEKYLTYANAVSLAESIPIEKSININQMQPGDVLVFKFSVLHKSNSVISRVHSRFTIQLRFADFSDPEFIENSYKPGRVSAKNTDYLKLIEKQQ